jgi:hypothetical protein
LIVLFGGKNQVVAQNALLERKERPFVAQGAFRAAYAEYWETEFKPMEQQLTRLGKEDLKL